MISPFERRVGVPESEDPAVACDAAELLKRHEALDAARAKISELFVRWEELDSRRR